MLDEDLWKLAHQLVAKHGVRATSFANHQALKAEHDGAKDLSNAWRSIAAATVEILRSEPSDEEIAHSSSSRPGGEDEETPR
jgi:hypothetical protein